MRLKRTRVQQHRRRRHRKRKKRLLQDLARQEENRKLREAAAAREKNCLNELPVTFRIDPPWMAGVNRNQYVPVSQYPPPGLGRGARRGSVSQQRTAREGELGSRRVLDSTKRPWRIRDRGLLYNGMLRIETDDQRYPLPVAMASESMADYLVKLHNEMLTKK